MDRLSKHSPTLAHSWLLLQILPILEKFVAIKNMVGGSRSRLHRTRRLLWRKLIIVKIKMEKATSVLKLSRLLQDRHDLELELKNMYKELNQQSKGAF